MKKGKSIGKKKNGFDLWAFILCLLIVFVAGFIGSLFTSNAVDSDWYKINRPSFTPPNYVFAPIWTILYILVAISLYLLWTNSKNKKQKRNILIIFGINLVLNASWSILFFGLKMPALAFVDIILMLFTIVLMVYYSDKINKTASYLLLPYFFWVCFASVLNAGFIF